MDPEILGDRLERRSRTALTGNPHDVVPELTGIGLGHDDILPGPPKQARSVVTPTRGRPVRVFDAT
jgi:hypothetical protein